MKIIVTGGTGLIGRNIINKLLTRGDSITIFTRGEQKDKIPDTEYITWTPGKEGEWEKAVEGKDGVIHLAGASIFGRRWNEDYKSKILSSRQFGTRSIVNAIGKAKDKPSVLVCASGIGYYGKDTGDRIITEADTVGDDFLAEVCRVWEEEAARVEQYNVRRVSMRTAIVLDKNEGALEKMILQFKLFSGGPLGSGEQWFSWIHIEDAADLYIMALSETSIKGSVNISTQEPVKMKVFAKTLGEVMRRPSWFRVPEFLLKLVLGESAEFILGGQKVKPERLMEMGYRFKYPQLKGALEDLI